MGAGAPPVLAPPFNHGANRNGSPRKSFPHSLSRAGHRPIKRGNFSVIRQVPLAPEGFEKPLAIRSRIFGQAQYRVMKTPPATTDGSRSTTSSHRVAWVWRRVITLLSEPPVVI